MRETWNTERFSISKRHYVGILEYNRFWEIPPRKCDLGEIVWDYLGARR